MRIFVLGDAPDVRGFALAGVDGACPEDRETARAFLAKAVDADPPVGLLLLSERIAGLLPREIDRLERSDRPPAVLVLPGTKR